MSDNLAPRPTLITPSDAYATLRKFALPQHLDGSAGTNRNPGRQQISADRDWDAIQIWLSQYRDRQATFLAYEKEVSRFYVWVILTLKKPLSSVVHEDWLRYTEFLLDPQPAALWVGAKRPRFGRDGRVSEAYKPFAGPLQPKSISFAGRAIWQMFAWLRDAGYLAGNPLLTLSRRRETPVLKTKRTDRMLGDDQWLCLLNWLAAFKRNTINARRQYARNRWLIALFYSTGIRSSEALTAKMGDIVRVRDPVTQKTRAFLQVIGKGSKPRDIPLTDEVLSELSLYRQSFGLPVMPAPREATPLIFSIQVKKRFRPITRQALYTVFKGMFEAAAETLEDEEDADHLRAASTHWLRHMAASAMLRNGTPLLVVRDVLGHADLATTSLYSHSQALDMHREVEAHNHLDLHQVGKQ